MALKWSFVLLLTSAVCCCCEGDPLSNPASVTGASERVSYRLREDGRNPLRRGELYPTTNAHGSGFPVKRANPNKGAILKQSEALGTLANRPPISAKKSTLGTGERISGPNPSQNDSPFNLISPLAFATQDPRFQANAANQKNNFDQQTHQNGGRWQQNSRPQQTPGYLPGTTQNRHQPHSHNSPTIHPSTYILHNFPNSQNPQFNILEDTGDKFAQSHSIPGRKSSTLAPLGSHGSPIVDQHRRQPPTISQSLFVKAPAQPIYNQRYPQQQQYAGAEGPILVNTGQGPQQRPVLLELGRPPGPTYGVGNPGSVSSSGSFSNFDDGRKVNYESTVRHKPTVNIAFDSSNFPTSFQHKNFQSGSQSPIHRPGSGQNLASGPRRPTPFQGTPTPQSQINYFPSLSNKVSQPSQYNPNQIPIRPSPVSAKPTYTRLVALSTPQPQSNRGPGTSLHNQLSPFSGTIIQNRVPVTQTRPQNLYPSSQNYRPQNLRPGSNRRPGTTGPFSPTSHLNQPQQFPRQRPLQQSSFAQPHRVHEEVGPPREYSYGYAVDDRVTGDQKSAYETRGPDGVVQGRYTVVQPDGLFRVVTYTADKENGFRAKVDYLPTVSVRGKSVKDGETKAKTDR